MIDQLAPYSERLNFIIAMEALLTYLLDAGVKGKLPKVNPVLSNKPGLAKIVASNLTKALNPPANAGKAQANAKTKRRGNKAESSTGVTVSAPVAIGTRKRNVNPRVSCNSRGKSYRVQKSEFIATINGTTTFHANKYVINPGMTDTFPWLSKIARQWEQYRFHKLTFQYVTRTNTSSTGSVILAPDYDSNDGAPKNEAQVTTYQDAKEEVCWTDSAVNLDVAAMFPTGARKYVRKGLIPYSDLRLYDAGNFFVCPTGQTSSDPIGKLWVHYDIEFFVPSTAEEEDPQQSKQTTIVNGANIGPATTGNVNITWTAPSINPLGVELIAPTLLRLPRGAYLCEVQTVMTLSGGGSSANVGVDTTFFKFSTPVVPTANRAEALGVSQNSSYTQRSAAYIESTGDSTTDLAVQFGVSATATGSATMTAIQLMISPA